MKSPWRIILNPSRLVLFAMILFVLTNCSSNTPSSSTEGPTKLPIYTQSTSVGKSIYSWIISGEIPRGLIDPPNEQFFESFVDAKRIDSLGGELIVRMNPTVDLDCVQQFRVGWEFDKDIETVREEDTINITVFNEGGLVECYKTQRIRWRMGVRSSLS